LQVTQSGSGSSSYVARCSAAFCSGACRFYARALPFAAAFSRLPHAEQCERAPLVPYGFITSPP